MTYCTFITYNDNISLAWYISDDQMEKCIREIEKADWKEIYTVPDDINSGIKQLFYIFEEPFVPKNTACFSKGETDKIYNITISCVNFTEPEAAFNDTTEYNKPLPEKWIRIVRVGLASFSVFFAAIIVCAILFLFVVLFKCIQRLLLVKRMPTSQYSIIKHVAADEGIEDVTQESSHHGSTLHYRQQISASKLLHLKDSRTFVGCLF
ncbi:unnamed protein product [Cercopithifilaria johnstoni]|uniref:Uncharacterized protein n=1 Tax=Cercopithifilaria johnstoni TaxID=2874296 RepID=A0A8J2M2U4_9BILA|nr:unnamed protein product [Cercopithifilaria johnstoni]